MAKRRCHYALNIRRGLRQIARCNASRIYLSTPAKKSNTNSHLIMAEGNIRAARSAVSPCLVTGSDRQLMLSLGVLCVDRSPRITRQFVVHWEDNRGSCVSSKRGTSEYILAIKFLLGFSWHRTSGSLHLEIIISGSLDPFLRCYLFPLPWFLRPPFLVSSHLQ